MRTASADQCDTLAVSSVPELLPKSLKEDDCLEVVLKPWAQSMRVIVAFDEPTAHDESFTARHLSPITVETARPSPSAALPKLRKGWPFSWLLRDARALSALWNSSRAGRARLFPWCVYAEPHRGRDSSCARVPCSHDRNVAESAVGKVADWRSCAFNSGSFLLLSVRQDHVAGN